MHLLGHRLSFRCHIYHIRYTYLVLLLKPFHSIWIRNGMWNWNRYQTSIHRLIILGKLVWIPNFGNQREAGKMQCDQCDSNFRTDNCLKNTAIHYFKIFYFRFSFCCYLILGSVKATMIEINMVNICCRCVCNWEGWHDKDQYMRWTSTVVTYQ